MWWKKKNYDITAEEMRNIHKNANDMAIKAEKKCIMTNIQNAATAGQTTCIISMDTWICNYADIYKWLTDLGYACSAHYPYGTIRVSWNEVKK